ncbi:hypothetical protein GGF32_008171 [Allomyces javanicus]|nr:hypothetical protein GGF32_008171 [Allomyces javanicus]
MAGPTKVMVRLTVRTRPHPQGKRDGPNRTPVYRFSVHVEALDLKTNKVPDARVLPRLCRRIAVELHETFHPPTRDLERQPDGTYLLHELDAWGSFSGKVLFEFHNEIHASIHMGFAVDLGKPEETTMRALVVRLADADKKKYLVTTPVPAATAPLAGGARKLGAQAPAPPPPPPPPLPYVPAPPVRAAAIAAARRIPAANAASPTAPSSSALSSVASSSPSSASSVSSAGGSPPLGATRSRGPTPNGARSIKEPAGAGQARASATVRSAPASARPSAAGPRTAVGAGDAAPPRRASTSAASRRPPADAPTGFAAALQPPPRAASASASSARGTASASARPAAGSAAPARPSAGPGKSRPPPPSSAVRDASRTRGTDRSPPPAAADEPRAPSRNGTAGAVKRPLPSSSSSASTTDTSPPPAKRARTESLTQQVARRGPAAAARGFPETRPSPPSDRPSPSVRSAARKPSPTLPSPPESAALVAAPPPPPAVPTSLSSPSPGTAVVAQIAAQIRTLGIDDVLELARLVHAHADDLGRVMTADAATNALQFHVAAFSPTLIGAVVAFLAEHRDRSGAGSRQVRPSAAMNGMQAAPPARMITS